MSGPSSMGILAILPPEIRLMIWSHLFYRKPNEGRKTKLLSILRANRALYHEVSAAIYDSLRVNIYTFNPWRHNRPWFPHDPYDDNLLWTAYHPWERNPLWAVFEIEKLNQSFTIDSYEAALYFGFGHFPWHRVRLDIWFKAPGGRIELRKMWKTAKELVDMLSKAEYIRSIMISFTGPGLFRWDKPVTPNVNLDVHQLKEYDVVFMPFCQLKNVQRLDVTFDSEDKIDPRFIQQGCHLINRVPLLVHDQQHREIAERLMNLETVMADVQANLDRLPRGPFEWGD